MKDPRPKTKMRGDAKGTSERLEAIRIRLLGGFEVSVGSRTIQEGAWRLRKAANLVKILALAGGNRLHREQVMYTLWPELGIRAASNNLRQTVHTARRTFDLSMGYRYLASRDESLVLCPESSLWVDVDAFEEAARSARRSPEPVLYRAALDLYTGELLPTDRYEEWAEEPRRRLQQTYLSLLLGLAHLHEELADYDCAIEALRRVVSEEPTREEAHAGLMRLYALVGNNGEAIAQYGRLEETLSRALGTEPAASSRALREEIAAGRFPLTEGRSLESPPEGSPDAAKHNLPATRSSFVGREPELRNLKRDLAMTRLLTLTGVGGCGKTRLALEVARDLVGAYPDGVWFVELAPLSEGALVAQAVATVLGVQEQSDRSLTDTLVNFLRPKRVLLVLDNCEHLVNAVAHFVVALLNSSPHLRVLATSRESLNVEGELSWLVPSLSVPSMGRSPRVEELAGYESVGLFVERARHRNPVFSLTPQNAPAVARICERLDGIPLAIELAAARVGLSVEQIATRLDDSLRLLTKGNRTASPRQRTLRGTLHWSHALLSEPERRLFCGLSVFAGGWTLEAAEVVGAGDTDQDEVLDLLSRLVDKSLVVGEPTGVGEVRYRMLEPIRQYARAKLEEGGDAEEIRRRHASFYLALTEYAEPRLHGPEDVMWLERFKTEHGNMRAVLSWALERGEVELGLRLAGASWHFWEAHGHYSEGKRWLEAFLGQQMRASAAARAKALEGLAWFTDRRGDTYRAKSIAEEGLRLSHEAKLTGAWTANFLRLLGWMAERLGDHERANELLEESLKLSQDADDKVGIARSLLELGGTSYTLGDRRRAMELYEEGIVVSRELGYTLGLVDILLSMGSLLLLEGDYERGATLNEEAAALLRERGYITGLEHVLDNAGWAALLQDDHERARTSFAESLMQCRELGDKLVAADSLEGLACSAGVHGKVERAAILFGAAEVLREAGGIQHTTEEDELRKPYLAASRARLDEGSWRAAWAQGRAMSMERAIEYALSEAQPLPSSSPESEQSSSDEPPSLTRREKEVAILVARGLTNRQIASELVLSEHTVHHHVTNILKKMNLSSRQQIASRLSDR
ncbi:MAG TPA: BTAD domain-containing putative transcriptional regulator [Rubrobacter sp.]|nr:BTAD domain-containing putative transcriptional regulator [Rubrobacter sp.]